MRKSFPIKHYWFLGFFVFVGLQFDVGFALAQPILKDSYQGIGQVPAKNKNYVEARRKAVIYAMKNAIEKVFKDLKLWLGKRAQSGRLAPRGFPRSNCFN